MQTFTKPLALALSGALLVSLAACNSGPSSDAAEATVSDAKEAPAASAEAVPFTVVPEDSKFTWIGAKLTGNHNGTINIRDGAIMVQGNNITGGKVVFDMASLRAEDVEMDEANNKKLTGHLMSGDFFEVAKYPTATFEITGVEPLGDSGAPAENDSVRTRVVQNNTSERVTDVTHKVTGNLTIKDVTKSVTFPAKIDVDDTKATAKASFIIDRTDWGLNYMSEKSFADKMIFREVNIQFDLTAKK